MSTENKIIKANLNDIKEECNILVDTVEYYQKLAQRGVHLDTNFQAIKKLWKNKSEESLAEISLPEKILSQTNPYTIHPVLLDACFQWIGITLLEEDQNITYLPIGLD